MTRLSYAAPPADGGPKATPRPALLLIGHGSARNPHSRKPTERLAGRLAEQGAYTAVRTAFLKESPSVGEALESLAARGAEDVRVIPMFAGEGYFTRKVIPDLLQAANFPGRLTQTPAVGAHPRLEDIIRRRAADALRQSGAVPEDAALILVGHGSTKPGGASTRGKELAARLDKGCRCRGVIACFLEEAPFVRDWPALTDATTVIVLPLLIAEGLHGSRDLPPLFGLRPEDVTENAPALIGPVPCDGRQVLYWRGIGSDPEILDIIQDMLAATSVR